MQCLQPAFVAVIAIALVLLDVTRTMFSADVIKINTFGSHQYSQKNPQQNQVAT